MFSTIRKIINWCGEFKGRLYVGFVFSFFSYWFAAAPVFLSAMILGDIIENGKTGTAIENSYIVGSVCVILLAIGLRFLFDYFRARFQETISYELTARDRLAIGEELKRVSLGYFQNVSTGNILSSLTTGLATLENMGIRMIDTFIGGYLNFIALLIFLFIIKPEIAVIAILATVVSFGFLVVISRCSRKYAPEEAASNRTLTGAALEYARGLSVIKSFGKKGAALCNIDEAIETNEKIHLKVEWGFLLPGALHLLALKCGTIGIGLASCYGGYTGELSFTMMLMMVFLSFTIFNGIEPVSDSVHVLGVIDDAMEQVEKLKVSSFMDEDGKDIQLDNYNIEFRNVDFGYANRKVIKDVSFKIPEKTSTAIIGPSGSGKTTIVNLLARFYDVDQGNIFIGGHDVKEFTCDSLISNMSMVFQNVYLFNDTIRNNICFGSPNISEEEMISAAKKACCHDFIMELPDGYDTVIGEGGGTLSGGEKQRISIARAILKDAPIIILDEATASIDPENEHLIQAAITQLTKGKTVITIAHRLSTIEHADQILVIDGGKLVQKGTHGELIKEEGVYRRFTQVRSRAEQWKM